MYTERFSLPFLSGVLMAAAERKRPGLADLPAEQRRAALLGVFRDELAQVKGPFLEVFNDPGYWGRLEKALLEDVFLRYMAESERQLALEKRGYDLWRGGDLVARSAFAGIGLALGIFLVKAPFIPIPETWDLLILAMFLGAPFVPDLQVWVAQKRYARRLQQVVQDMEAAQETHKLYEPLGLDAAQQQLTEVASPTQQDPAVPAGHRQGDKS